MVERPGFPAGEAHETVPRAPAASITSAATRGPAPAADVVVVGGGILGLVAAWQLHRAGVERIVVLKRDAVTSATTAAGAGFVAVWAAGHAHATWTADEAALERVGIDFYCELAAAGSDIGLRRHGMLWVATSAAGHDEHLAPIVDHPLAALAVARITSAPCGIAAEMPLMLFPEAGHLWVREEAGGLLYGASFECPPRYDVLERVPVRFDELALDGFFSVQASAQRLAPALPPLRDAVGLRVKHGAPCYTPDLRGLVGPVPEVEGLWVVGGCNEAGVTHAAGYGAVLAAAMTGTAPPCDPAPFALRRFGTAVASPREVVAAMTDRGRLAWVAMER